MVFSFTASLLPYAMHLREDLLHYAWQFQAFDRSDLLTTSGQKLDVLHPGSHNQSSGPDFADGRLAIAGLRWAGAVECHLKSSDWHQHGHSDDPAYARVVLHVVWEHDAEVTLPDGSLLPVLELKGRVSPHLLARYQALTERLHPGPACLSRLPEVPGLVTASMQERALLDRLQAKADRIEATYQAAGRDWEETAYRTLARAWGAPYNGAAFEKLAAQVPVRHLRRLADNPLAVEALLLGQAGLLHPPAEPDEDTLKKVFRRRINPEPESPDPYVETLRREFCFQAARLQLPAPAAAGTLATGRMRPAQQPALRLAQLAALLNQVPPLFDTFRSLASVGEGVELLRVTASPYWQRRYSLGPEGKTGTPRLGQAMALGLLANTVAPLLVAFGRQRSQHVYIHQALKLLEELPPEHNHLTRPFTETGLSNRNTAQSQGLLGLNSLYCEPGRCLQCQIGAHLLGRPLKGEGGAEESLSENRRHTVGSIAIERIKPLTVESR